MFPGREEKADILAGMAATFPLRNNARAEKQGMTQILEDYPQFMNYDGEVVSFYSSLFVFSFSHLV